MLSGAKVMNFAFKTRNFVSKSHKTRNFPSKTRSFVLKMMIFAELQGRLTGLLAEGECIKNDEFFINDDEFCIINDGFCIKNDGLCRCLDAAKQLSRLLAKRSLSTKWTYLVRGGYPVVAPAAHPFVTDSRPGEEGGGGGGEDMPDAGVELHYK